MSTEVVWSDEVDEVLRGDLTAAAAYVTPAGGAVVTAVAPCGLARREDGVVGFTTSLGLHRKLERILREPKVALAYHAREHGFSSSRRYVLAQGIATVDLAPSRERLEAILPQVERFLGAIQRGWLWDRLLREYYFERVFVDVTVARMSAWEHLDASGALDVVGAPAPEHAAPQQPPKGGTGPRVDVSKAARRVLEMPHCLLAYRGGDGFPMVVPVKLASHTAAGFTLQYAPGLLPPGGRRAGFLAHGYQAQLVGIQTQNMTGWLEVGPDGRALYAPHTTQGWNAPPIKSLLLFMNGMLAKIGYRRAIKAGVLQRLEELQRVSGRDGAA